MKRWVLLLVLFSGVNVFAQGIGENIHTYVDRYAHVAVAEMERYGIPASITLAQGILESACGKSRLATKANNHFGIKCKKHWKGKTIRHTDDAPNECFRAYSSAWESYRDHSEFLKNHRLHLYDSLFELDKHDYVGWAYGLKEAGYATAPNYAPKLVAIIEQYQLYQYDDPVFNYEEVVVQTVDLSEPVILGEPQVANQTLSSENKGPKTASLEELREDGTRKYELAYTFEELIPHLRKKSAVIVQKHGGKLHLVSSGDTMESIAQQHKVNVDRLYDRNKLAFGSQPAVGEWIYLHSYAGEAPRLKLINY